MLITWTLTRFAHADPVWYGVGGVYNGMNTATTAPGPAFWHLAVEYYHDNCPIRIFPSPNFI